MNNTRFIIRNLRYFKKQHMAVFFAAMISAAVLTGALIVGDSVLFSLNNLVNKRLGNIEYVMFTGDRFVSSQLSSKIANDIGLPCASVLLVQGIAISPESQKRNNRTQILGIDNDFWNLSKVDMPQLNGDKIIISQNIANKLYINIGDEILLRIQNVSFIPINAPFANDENQSIAIRVSIAAIANDDNLARFSLRNNQSAPFNIFIDRDFLSSKLELDGLTNLIVAAGNERINQQDINNSLEENWTMADAGLEINQLDKETFEMVSKRIFIDKIVSEKVDSLNIPHDNILTYFVNSLSHHESETPYSFVTAASQSFLGRPISDSEIIINEWLAQDLGVHNGDTIEMKYFAIGPLRTLEEKSVELTIADVIPMVGDISDKELMPAFPGLSDAGNCSDWDTGIPIDLKKIRDKDEQYWSDYRGTPKAYINIKKGLKLWDNRFGNFTSIRLNTFNNSKTVLENKLLSTIIPNDINLMFIDAREEGLNAASNGVDFGELFLSLSFFVIAAAILLTVLIYSLNSESRKTEIGILHGLGFTKNQILKLRFSESVITIILSAVIGGFAGILYNKLMITGLNSVWNNAVHADMLEVFIVPQTIITGIIIGIITSVVSIYIVTVQKLRKTITSAINEEGESKSSGKSMLSAIIAGVGFLGSIAIIIFSVINSIEGNSGLMLLAGFLFMLGCTSLIYITLNRSTISKKSINRALKINYLVLLNAGRNKKRSIAVIILLAIGTFTIVVTGANRKTFTGTENQRESGTGGFSLWAENTVPILQDLNTIEGKSEYGLDDISNIDGVTFTQFYNLPGDDASCLNLNQIQNPQLLGIDPLLLDSLQAFSFAKLITPSLNPWLELNRKYEDKIIPAFADQTVIQWGLMKSIGDTLIYLNEYGEKIKLIIVGGLNSSIFQGNLLISKTNFINNFPGSGGSKIMLVDAPEEKLSEAKEKLTYNLSDYGIDIESTSGRLAGFYSVTNTYLTIFMILGGLGVILGTIGLGIVIMRNIHDRKKEIALLEALGFNKSQVFSIIFKENLFLLITGIVIGFVSALIGILPSILSPAFHIPGNFLFILVTIVFLSGLLWIYLPTRFSLKKQLLENLRKE